MKKHFIMFLIGVAVSGQALGQKKENSDHLATPYPPARQHLHVSNYGATNPTFLEENRTPTEQVHCENTAAFRRGCALTGATMFVGLWVWFAIESSRGHYQVGPAQAVFQQPAAPFP